MRRHNTKILLTVFLIAVLNVGQAADLRVIAHRDVPADTLTIKELQRIFYGKMTLWPDETSIVPVTLVAGDTQDEFLRDVLKKAPDKYKVFWRQAIFTGEGMPPREFRTQAQLLDYVAKQPGSIGFASDPDASLVKIIMIIEP